MKRVMMLLATTVLLIALLAGTAMAQSSASAPASASAAAAAAQYDQYAPATAQYDQYATASPTAGVTDLPATGGAPLLAVVAGVLLVGAGLLARRIY